MNSNEKDREIERLRQQSDDLMIENDQLRSQNKILLDKDSEYMNENCKLVMGACQATHSSNCELKKEIKRIRFLNTVLISSNIIVALVLFVMVIMTYK